MRALLCGLLLAGMAFGAAPPARLTPEQAKLLRQRDALSEAGKRAWQAGKQAEAIASLEKALRIQQGLMGPGHRGTENIAGWLAYWHWARGEWGQEARYRRMVSEARRALFGEGHWRTVDARWDAQEATIRAGWTAAQNGKWGRAEALNKEVFRLWQRGRPVEALPLAKEALSIRLSLVGEKHPRVAQSLFNLAAQYRSMGEYKAALPLYQKALLIRKEALGERHPHYARSLNNLASLYKEMGEYKQALPLFQKALVVYKQVLGEKHPEYAQGLSTLAALYQDMGDHKEALPRYQRALAIRKEALGERHPAFATSLNNLASLYKDMGEYKQALPLIKKSLKNR
jgi:Tfp pilus assembly protein PilF